MSDTPVVITQSEFSCGNVRLHCKQAAPVGEAWARLLIVHGYGEHCGRYAHFMRWLAERGVASETIDQRGHGRSTGKRAFVTKWDEYLDDFQALLSRAVHSSTSSALPLYILGHSHGGLIVVNAVERGMLEGSQARGCVLASPFLSTLMPTAVWKRILARVANRVFPGLRVATGIRRDWITQDPEMTVDDRDDPLINRFATPRWWLTMQVAQKAALENANQFKLPVLCMVGESDIVADPAAARRWVEKAGSTDKLFKSYPRAVHELFRDVGRKQAFSDVLEWMRARATTSAPTG